MILSALTFAIRSIQVFVDLEEFRDEIPKRIMMSNKHADFSKKNPKFSVTIQRHFADLEATPVPMRKTFFLFRHAEAKSDEDASLVCCSSWLDCFIPSSTYWPFLSFALRMTHRPLGLQLHLTMLMPMMLLTRPIATLACLRRGSCRLAK
jgi:hypothetical protein